MKTRKSFRFALALFALASLALLAAVSCKTLTVTGNSSSGVTELTPIDPQNVQDQDDMTWDDYNPIPGKNWADPSLKPEREFHMALVAVDFPDKPFVITQPKNSDPFGNPQIEPIPREDVPQFYADFWLKPSEVNHGQTINGYWMEQSRGKFGITKLDAYGPYRMPHPSWYYGLNEHRQNDSTPDGSRATGRMEQDVDALWRADQGDDIADQYRRPDGAVLRIYAGYDETGVWQEFGEMKFNTKEDITPEWGNPNPDMPRWVPTRYVEWTSWLAGSQQWGLSSIRQGENSGTITHELGHFAFSIGDLNNNPYITPYRRVAVGPWDMMDRACFNGPGGPHSRWEVPAIAGASMPAPLMVRNKLVNGFITWDDLLMLNRNGLAQSGLAVCDVTCRDVDPLPGTFAGVTVTLDGDGDLTPEDDPETNPLSPGVWNYNFYSMEVVQRIGYDSFCPDNGVLLAKNTNQEVRRSAGPNGFNAFIWVIDAHPEDINEVDYVKPNGEKVMRTVADYRQTNDAAFHAGLNSGSEYEYEDGPNRLHFYVIDIHKNEQGILSYTLGVRSLDGSGPQQRGAELTAPSSQKVGSGYKELDFTLTNTGQAAQTNPNLHWRDFNDYLTSDIYRLSVEVASIDGAGWKVKLLNGLAAVKFGQSQPVKVYVAHEPDAAPNATVILTARSESDPSKVAIASVKVSR